MGETMIETITKHKFTDTMTKPYNGFNYDGANALFSYLEELEESSDTVIEFDPIAIRCNYVEYNDLAELNKDFAPLYYENDYDMKSLAEVTTVIEVDGTSILIIKAF